jgi:hypothetical protein
MAISAFIRSDPVSSERMPIGKPPRAVAQKKAAALEYPLKSCEKIGTSGRMVLYILGLKLWLVARESPPM